MNGSRITTLFLVLCLTAGTAKAQYASPVEYMNYLGELETEMAKDYMNYMSAMAHTNSARKLEKRRQEVLLGIREGQKKVAQLKAFKGDVKLREAYRKYLAILLAVMSEDYGKIVDMEEIAEQSYDKMEAWLLAQEKAREKLHIATDSVQASYKKFADNNNVRLIESESAVSKKLGITSTVMAYYNKIYLIHFKVYKQEAYTITALNSGDINGIEQNRSTQSNYADEGLEKLKLIQPFERDISIVTACRKMLEFHKVEAETKIAGMTDYLIKKEEFTKFKREYDSKPREKHTQGDVDDYNAFINEMNKLGDNYNKTNEQLNTQRNALLQNWNSAVNKFLDTHIPR